MYFLCRPSTQCLKWYGEMKIIRNILHQFWRLPLHQGNSISTSRRYIEINWFKLITGEFSSTLRMNLELGRKWFPIPRIKMEYISPSRPAIVVLLMSMVNEKQPFYLRCAVLYCFQSFLYKNELGQSQIVQTLLPSTADGGSTYLSIKLYTLF